MTRLKIRAFHAVASAIVLAACLASGPVAAQAWPAKPVRVIVSIGTGSALDFIARMFSEAASKSFGQQFFVENIMGASGIIGAQTVARAAPDGYTLYVAPSSVLASNPYMFKSLPYNAFTDFTPIAILSDSGPLVFAVNSELPVKTLPDLIAMAKAAPGKLSYGVDASSGYLLLTGRLLKARAGIDVVEVPYKVGAQVIQDAGSGRTQYVVGSFASVSSFVKAGKLRMIAITSAKRFPGMDDLPTAAETLPGFRMDGWYALVGPAGVPDAVVRRLNREAEGFVTRSDVIQRQLQFGIAISGPRSPEATATFIRSEQDYWDKLSKELRIEPQ